MLFKENRYQCGPYVGDTMFLTALPPCHSCYLLVIAVPCVSLPPRKFIDSQLDQYKGKFALNVTQALDSIENCLVIKTQ